MSPSISAARSFWRYLVLLLILACGATLAAQRGFGRFRLPEGVGAYPPRYPPANFEDGSFMICKLEYTSVRREAMGMGWSTDYPYAGINLMIRMSELTRAHITKKGEGEEPVYWVVRLTDDALFHCPILMASDVGTMGLSDGEAKRLREYLLKGGFLWVDDYWGDYAWDQWVEQIARVLPPAEFPIVELPLGHAIWPSQFLLKELPQIPAIQSWRRLGYDTSERGEESRTPHFRGIADKTGRVFVVMTHNTDISDTWEREGENKEYFDRFSPDGYAVGVNIILYALTH